MGMDWDIESNLTVSVTDGNLSLREAPNTSARRIAVLKDGEAALFLERTAAAETIDTGQDGIRTAPWYRVRTSSGLEGWSYGGFLVCSPAVSVIGSWSGTVKGFSGPVTVSFIPDSQGRLSVEIKPGSDEAYRSNGSISATQGLPYLINCGRGQFSFTHLSVTVEELRYTFTPTEKIGQLPTVQGSLTRISWWPEGPVYIPRTGESLIQAVLNNDLPALKAAVEAGADPNQRSSERGATALHLALAHPSRAACIPLLLEAGADPNIRDNREDTPFALFLGIHRTPAEVEMFLRNGADPNARSGSLDTDTPFILVVAERTRSRGKVNLDLVSLLLLYGADPNTDTDEYWVPMLAIDARDYELMELLLKNGLTADSSGFGYTVLEYARESGDAQMIRLIESV